MKNKKGLLASVLTVVMIVCCAIGLTACGECTHKWGDWTTINEATCLEQGLKERKCSDCGETETSRVEALGHDWESASCTAPKTCKNCSATEGSANAHTYDQQVVKTETLKSVATCTSPAVYYKSCTCGAISQNGQDTFTSGVALEHVDENKDHVCDRECGEDEMGLHEDSDEDDDHNCDYCGAKLNDCFDENGDDDHDCDVCGKENVTSHRYSDATCNTLATCLECGETTGSLLQHEDKNKDHICDRNCNKTDMGTCEDKDKDHACDYGCSKAYGTCEDKDKDHACDYGCSKAFGTCEDKDKDHACDYGCSKAFGTCEDKDKDHACDYGCSKAFGTCEDKDKDHACDYGCSKVFGTCEDIDKDHACDYGCNKAYGTCEDKDKDHACDYGCNKAYGTCEDKDKDHTCDYGCGKAFGTCEDKDKDHACDYGCGKAFGTCEDKDKDHACDYGCNKAFGTCEDIDKDHACDYGCNEVFGEHLDSNEDDDHGCDYCGEKLNDCEDADNDGNHDCDVCGEKDISEHRYSDATCTNPKTCSECGKTDGEELGHIDNNKDHICDRDCGKTNVGKHEDSLEDNDHACDYCGATLNSCSDEDNDGNHDCDVCGNENVSAHRYSDATCTTPKTCYECGETIGSTLEHVYDQEDAKDEAKKSDATCTSPAVYYKSCSCGLVSTSAQDTFTYGDVKPHDYSVDKVGDGTLKSVATCTSPAVYYKSCTCGAVSEDETFTSGNTIPHAYNVESIEGTLKSVATCTSPAVYYKSCTCGLVSTSELETFTYGDKLDHTYTEEVAIEGTLKSVASCTSPAVYYKSCTCGAVSEDETFTSGQKNAHSYEKTSTPATCLTAKVDTFRCSVCGDEYEENDGSALGHDVTDVTATERFVDGCKYVLVYDCKRCTEEVLGEEVYHHDYVASITKVATCKDEGEKTFRCSVCGDTSKKAEVIPADATGHNWEKGEVSDGTRKDTCSYCNETKTVTVYEGNKTDSTNASNLANKEIELNDANINLGSGVVDAIGNQDVTVSADKLVGEDRNELGLSPNQLGQVGDNPIYNFTINNGSENISNFGESNFVTITLPYKLTEGEDVDSIAVWFISDKCAVKECTEVDCKVVAHRLVSIMATYNNGYVTFKTNHFSYYTVTTLTVEERCALYGHSYVCQHVDGNCTKDEYDLYVCVRCHDKYIDEKTFVPGDGHDFVATTYNATCTTSGYVHYECEDCSYNYKIKINATGHDYRVLEQRLASCTLNGYVLYGCANCGSQYTVTSDKLPHEYQVTSVSATCESDGYTLHDCKNCDYSYTTSYVKALGHDYVISGWNWAEDYSQATLEFVCQNDGEHVLSIDAHVSSTVVEIKCSGYSLTTYEAAISYNNRVYSDQKIIEVGEPIHVYSADWFKNENEHWHECACGEITDVESHVFENAVVTLAPTCTENGEELSTCACGRTSVTVIPATGVHNYLVVEEKQSSCTEEGYIVYGCTTCDDRYTETLGVIDHVYNETVVLPTCETEGYTEFKCVNCDFVYTDSFVDALGHDYKVAGWDWAEDYKSASLSIVCKNNADHVVNVDVQVEIIEINYDCTDYSKTVYTAQIEYDGVMYKDEKIVEVGNDEHVYSSEWSVDDNEHWRECACGERTDVSNHEFENEEVTKEATCTENGAKIATCECGKTKTTVIPATGVHNYVEGKCDSCGKLESDCDHTVLHKETIDLSELGTCEGGIIIYQTCECGEVKILDQNRSRITCQVWVENPDTFVDEDGNQCMKGVSTCPECGLQMEMQGKAFEENCCTEVTEYWYTFKLDGDIVIENLYFKMSYVQHSDYVQDVIDLSNYDVCGGKLDVYKCKDCNEILALMNPDVDCNIDVNQMPEPKTYTDKDGFVHMLMEMTCPDCGLTIYVDSWTDEYSICAGSEYMAMGVKVGDIVILDIVQGMPYNNHEFETKRELLGENCLEGVRITEECSICGIKNSYTANYHDYDDMESGVRLDLSEYSACGGYIIYDKCNACDCAANLQRLAVNCSAFKQQVEPEEVKGEDGLIHYIASVTCPDCGLVLITDSWLEWYSECEYNACTSYKVYYGETCIFNYIEKLSRDEHEWEYKYEMDGETCEDGYIVNRYCAKCGNKDKWPGSGHDDEWFEINLKEYGGCGGNISGYRCNVCGKVEINQMMVECNINGEPSEDQITTYTDEKGILHQAVTMICPDCGLKFVMDMWAEQVNACIVNNYQKTAIYVKEECIFEFTATFAQGDHVLGDPVYILGEYGCNSNYIVRRTCTVCGAVVDEEDWGHKFEYCEINFEEAGYCAGYACYEECLVCHERRNETFQPGCKLDGEPSVDSYTDKDGILHQVATMECPDCALKYVVDSWQTQEYACIVEINQIIYVYAGEDCLVDFYQYIPQGEHQIHTSYERIGESCEYGYKAIEYCDNCDYYNENTFGGHCIQNVEDNLSNYGLCGGFISYSKCLFCNYVGERYSIRENCSFTLVEETDETKVYTCRKCGATKYEYYAYGEKDNSCWCEITKTISYNLNGVEVYRFEVTTWNQKHNLDIKYEFYGEEGDCESGYYKTEKCMDCDYFNDYESYSHDVERNTIRLTDFGICGGFIEEQECRICGLRRDELYNNYYCDWRFVDKSEDGNGEILQCSKCNVIKTTCWTNGEKDENCKFIRTCVTTYIMNDEVVYVFYSSDYDTDHDCSYEYQKYGETCDDGYLVMATCKDCGHYEEWGGSGHDTQSVEVNLSDLGLCGGYTNKSVCRICNEVTYSYVNDYACEWQWIETEGDYEHYRCNACGTERTITWYETDKDGYCNYYFVRVYTYALNGEVVHTFETFENRNEHDYSYEYQKYGETCDDGYLVMATCKDCGHYEEWESSGHHDQSFEVNLSDYGLCGGNTNKSVCRICNEMTYYNVNDHYCDWQWIEAEGDCEYYECKNCGTTKTISYYSGEKDENCNYKRFCTYNYSRNGEVVYTFETYWYNTDHAYEYSYSMYGKTCNDGYLVMATCKDCGHYEEWDGSGHDTQSVEVNLSDYGLCGGYAYEYHCVVCKEITDVDINEDLCGWNHIETNDQGQQVYECYNCGATRLEYNVNGEKDEYCYGIQSLIYSYLVNGVEVYNCKVQSWYTTMHDYVYNYAMHGNGCEEGYTTTVTCKDCDFYEEYENNGHNTNYKTVRLSKYGLCGGYTQVSTCTICNEVTYSYVDDYSCSWETIESREDGYEVAECKNCGTTRTISYYNGEKDKNCNYKRTKVYSYSRNGEVVYTFEDSWYNEDHTYGMTFQLHGVSCEDGYTVTMTCKDCNYSYDYEQNYHENFIIYELEDEYDLCNHLLYVSSCPCGQDYYVSYNNGSFDCNEDNVHVCADCGITYSQNTVSVENGCEVSVVTQITISLGDTILYNDSVEKVYSNHNYTETEVIDVNGTTVITNACDKCGMVVSGQIMTAQTTVKENGVYYYDYVITPDTTKVYTIMGISNGTYQDTFVVLYKEVGGEYVNITNVDYGGENGHFGLTKRLVAGTTYLFRMGDYGDNNEEVSFDFILVEGDNYECRHNYERNVCELAPGSTSCEDGAYYGSTCVQCGKINSLQIINSHNSNLVEVIDLAEKGACYGTFYRYSCACGEEENVYVSNSHGAYTTNKHYNDEGKLIYEETYNCSSCNLRYTTSYYTEKDRINCTLTYYYTVIVSVAGNLIAEVEYTTTEESHDYTLTATLVNGEGSSCEDGVVITNVCKDCSLEVENTYNYHYTFEKERIEISQSGSVCGGYATYSGCACENKGSISLDDCLCELESVSTGLWIDGAVTTSQYDIDGYNYYGNSSYLRTCAVTDPTRCAYKIRYASYYLKAQGECYAYQYETWQFGYNEETNTCLYEITFKTGDRKVCHNYVDSSTDNHTKYDCADCGSYYYKNYYFDVNGNRSKTEIFIENKLNNGQNKYHEEIEEYTNDNGYSYCHRDYVNTISSNNETYWSETLTSNTNYVGSFGDPGREVKTSTLNSNGETRKEESAYVNYKGYQFNIYDYSLSSSGYWYRYDYSYTFDNGCVRTERYTNSDGEDRTTSHDACKMHRHITIKAPTCTQDGLDCYECVICSKQGEPYVVAPSGHSWSELSSSWYVCTVCGIENANGVSGDIIMEDLTDTYGNGENYVVGYYIRNDVEFTKYVSLVNAYNEEFAIVPNVEYFEVEGVRAVAFSKSYVDAWATEQGYTDYLVKFNFVPFGADDSQDYAITFTENVVPEVVTQRVSFNEFIDAGEEKSYVITPAVGGEWVFASRSSGDNYAILYDAEGNELISNDDGYYGNNFKLFYDLTEGETYVIKVRWYGNETSGNIKLYFGNNVIA